jgi:hypothetical protein
VIDVDPHLPMRKENPETRLEEKGSKEVGSVVALVGRGYFVRGLNFSRISYDQTRYLSLLGLLLVELTTLGNAGKDLLAVLVELEGGDDDLGGGDAEGNGLAVGLLAGDAVDVDDPLETVDSCDLALAALVGATDNGDLIVLADGDRADLNDTFISIIAKTADRRALFGLCMCMGIGLLRETTASDGRVWVVESSGGARRWCWRWLVVVSLVVGGVGVRRVLVVIKSDWWCHASLNASISFLCVQMRRRRIGFRACIRCTSHGAPWREGRS